MKCIPPIKNLSLYLSVRRETVNNDCANVDVLSNGGGTDMFGESLWGCGGSLLSISDSATCSS